MYRTVMDYGVAPWTLGAYLNSEEHGRRETERILNSFYGGLIVLVVQLPSRFLPAGASADRSRTLLLPVR